MNHPPTAFSMPAGLLMSAAVSKSVAGLMMTALSMLTAVSMPTGWPRVVFSTSTSSLILRPIQAQSESTPPQKLVVFGIGAFWGPPHGL